MWRGLDGPTFSCTCICKYIQFGRPEEKDVLCRCVESEGCAGPDCFMQVHVFVYFLGSQREPRVLEEKTNIVCAAMSSSFFLHPMASLTDSECKRLDAIIRAVGSRLNRQLRKNGESARTRMRATFLSVPRLLW